MIREDLLISISDEIRRDYNRGNLYHLSNCAINKIKNFFRIAQFKIKSVDNTIPNRVIFYVKDSDGILKVFKCAINPIGIFDNQKERTDDCFEYKIGLISVMNG